MDLNFEDDSSNRILFDNKNSFQRVKKLELAECKISDFFRLWDKLNLYADEDCIRVDKRLQESSSLICQSIAASDNAGVYKTSLQGLVFLRKE